MARASCLVLVLSAVSSFVVSQTTISGLQTSSSPSSSASKTNSETFTTSTALTGNHSIPAKETTLHGEHSNDTSPTAGTTRDPISPSEPNTSISSTIHANTIGPTGNTTSGSSTFTTSPFPTWFTTLASSVTSSTNDTNASENITPNAEVVGGVSGNPGLVAVLCIFFIVLALVLTIAVAKAISSRKNKFERLHDLQMNKMNEGSPFAHYPPK
ncbi:putative LOC729966 homolog [Scleropages formosus]|uniref:putative LOC729966 homolog n=1 Tax=Scleropages formosus TaxID=113540 RepID=UPI000878093C|nr:endochitinase A-like [Scleropages formosus]